MEFDLHISENGSLDSTPVVLLHGFPLDSRIWEDALPLLTPHHVASVDLPGFGRSAPVVAVTMRSVVEILRDNLRRRGLLPCVLCGLSMGGYVALEFIRHFRADVCGLILVDTKSAADDPAQRAGRDAMIARVRSGGAAAIAEEMLPNVLGLTSRQTRPEVVRRAREMMRSQSSAGIEAALTAIRDRPDYTDFLPRIELPTLIVVGEQDTIAPPSIAAGMGSRIVGSKMVAIGGAGHFTPLEAPDAFAAAVTTWLDESNA